MSYEHGTLFVVVGIGWGDEGKGKIVDKLACENGKNPTRFVIRGNGGGNAGHTVYPDEVPTQNKSNPRKFALHHVPSGVFNPEVDNFLGRGMVIDPDSLINELHEINAFGYSTCLVQIDPRAHLNLPWHKTFDKMQEILRGDERIGTTNQGIGPAYTDKITRDGLQMYWLKKTKAELMREIGKRAGVKAKIWTALTGEPAPNELREGFYEARVDRWRIDLGPRIKDPRPLIAQHLASGHNGVIEGAQGYHLGIDEGLYPKVTSSNTSVLGVLMGADIPLGSFYGPNSTHTLRAIGVLKAYATRVGEGGMPTELKNTQGDLIRQKGGEFGATTGRPRRVGYQDLVAARAAVLGSGITEFALTRIDTLAGAGELVMAEAYFRDQRLTQTFPYSDEELKMCIPVYRSNYRWTGDLEGITTFGDLPKSAQDYCLDTEKALGVPLRWIGNGPYRHQLIQK